MGGCDVPIVCRTVNVGTAKWPIPVEPRFT